MVAPPGLDPDHLDALLAALTRRRALVPILMLPAHLSMDPEDVATLLESAVDAGHVEFWDDAPGAPSVILSAAAARRRGLELVTDGLSRNDRFRWMPRREVKPERSQSLTESDLRDPETGWGGFDQMPDYGPSGVEMILVDVLEDPKLTPYLERHGVATATVDRREGRGEGRRKGAASMRYNPRLILGLRVQWPVVRRPGAPCQGCGSCKLADFAYCTVCDASGLDDVLAPVPAHMRPKAYRPDAKRAGGVGKKAKRKVKSKSKAGARAR